MEQSGGKSAQLVYQTPFFEEIDAIVSNRTNSVDFPCTPANLKAIGFAHLIQTRSEFIHHKHPAVYYREGVQVFSGVGYVLGITPTTIKMTFYWGNVVNFQALMDTSLQALQDITRQDHYTHWGAYIDRDPEYNWRTDLYVGEGRDDRQLPMLKVDTILQEITRQRGVSINFGNHFFNLAIPLVTKYKDAQSNIANSLHITAGATAPIKVSGSDYRFVLVPTWEDSDPSHQYIGDGVYDVEDAKKILLQVSAGFTVNARKDALRQERFGLSVWACDQDGENAICISEVQGLWTKRHSGSDTMTITLQENLAYEVDIERYSYVYLRLCQMRSRVFPTISGVNLTMVNTGGESDGEVEYGGLFPLYRNLPDISQGQFLKNLLHLRGLFAYTRKDNEVELVSTDILYDNLSKALDWSDKVLTDRGLYGELSPTYGSFARVNHMRWKDSDEIRDNYDGDIVVANDTLDESKDLFTMDFAPIQDGRIPLWESEDGQEWSFNSSCAPRLFRYGQPLDGRGFPCAYFHDEFAFDNIIRKYYSSYQRILYRPYKVKVSVRYTIAELVNMDMTIPVYIRQFGAYFAILKLTTKDERTAEAELLKIEPSE